MALVTSTTIVRIAFEWLDAQIKIQGTTRTARPLKHLIEKWAGRYVSQADVEVAAYLHQDVRGKYPHFNISSRLTEPSINRLSTISEARTQKYRERHDPTIYKRHE
jgi:hypothetical protein